MDVLLAHFKERVGLLKGLSLKGRLFRSEQTFNTAWNRCPSYKMNTVTENYWLMYAAATVIWPSSCGGVSSSHWLNLKLGTSMQCLSWWHCPVKTQISEHDDQNILIEASRINKITCNLYYFILYNIHFLNHISRYSNTVVTRNTFLEYFRRNVGGGEGGWRMILKLCLRVVYTVDSYRLVYNAVDVVPPKRAPKCTHPCSTFAALWEKLYTIQWVCVAPIHTCSWLGRDLNSKNISLKIAAWYVCQFLRCSYNWWCQQVA